MRRSSARRRDAGETLIELIVAIAIIGSVVTVVIGALTAIVANAAGQRTDARAQTVLDSFAAVAKATPMIPCATPAEYNARLAGTDPSTVYTIAVTSVAWWNGSTYQSATTRLADPVGSTDATITVADPTVLPGSGPYTINVGSGASPELMTVTGGYGTASLSVDRTAPAPLPTHAAGEPVQLCPPSSNRYNLQLLGISVTGPQTGIAGKAGAYTSAISVAKRGPLLIPTLTTAPVTATATAGDTIDDAASLGYIGHPPSVKPTGTMTFNLFAPSDTACTGTPVFTSGPVAVDGLASYGSGPYSAFLSATDGPGAYNWTVSYSGDAAFQGASSVCGATGQSVDVEKATPTLTASASPSTIAAGSSSSDNATLAGGVGPGGAGPTGTISFELYGPNDAGCSGTPTVDEQVTVSQGNNQYTLPTTFNTPGTYEWIASYSGDVNNAAVAPTACDDSTQTVTVTGTSGTTGTTGPTGTTGTTGP